MERPELSRRIHVSPSYISLIENGKRTPKRHVINDIGDVLALSFEQRNALLRAAGHEEVKARPDAEKEIHDFLTGLELSERETGLLMRELRAHARRWVDHRRARDKNVRTAVILAAGWQSRLLAADQLDTMLLHAVEEALQAGIRNVVIVIASQKSVPKFGRVRELLKVEPEVVQQDEPIGLGNAILCAKPKVEEEPFAVILPVDVDPTRRATEELLIRYNRVRKPLLAVSPKQVFASAERQHYGSAVLGKQVLDDNKKVVDDVFYVDEMKEKQLAAQAARLIVGRYILTPDIFDVLEKVERNKETGKLELTDALEHFRKSHHYVCAYSLKTPLLPLSSVRAIMEMLIDSMSDPAKLKETIKAARKVLRLENKSEPVDLAK